MSFASDTKNELSRLDSEKKCCVLAEIAGFIRMCGSVGLLGGGRLELKLSTENPAIARLFHKRLKGYFGVGPELTIAKNQSAIQKRGHVYELVIGWEDNAEQILREVGILRVKEGRNYISEDILPELIRKKCCKKAYLRGAFLGGGTLNHPNKGYHLEFVCSNEALAADMKKLINSFGLRAKTTVRKRDHVVYLKESEQIVDLLNILGAHQQLLKFEDVRITKEMRNQANRLVNCESANTDKAIDNAVRQIEDIRVIENGPGLDSLPAKLQEVAKIRLANPEANLRELGELLDPPLQKSGIYHRLAKISAIADQLRKDTE